MSGHRPLEGEGREEGRGGEGRGGEGRGGEGRGGEGRGGEGRGGEGRGGEGREGREKQQSIGFIKLDHTVTHSILPTCIVRCGI